MASAAENALNSPQVRSDHIRENFNTGGVLSLGKGRRARQKTRCAFCSGVVSAWCRLLRKSDV